VTNRPALIRATRPEADHVARRHFGDRGPIVHTELLGFVVHLENAPSTAVGYARIAHLSAPRVTSKGEAPVAKRTDDQAATPVGGIRLRVARRAERHEAVEIEVRAALSALDDGVDLERAPVTPADAPGRRPA
jgi:hypothetical protein